MVYFPNCRINIYEEQESDEYDDYTGELKSEWILVDTLSVDFQRLNHEEQQQEWGKDVKDTFKVYVPLKTHINNRCIVKIIDDIEDRTFDVIGEPEYWNRFHMFRKIILQVQRRSVL